MHVAGSFGCNFHANSEITCFGATVAHVVRTRHFLQPVLRDVRFVRVQPQRRAVWHFDRVRLILQALPSKHTSARTNSGGANGGLVHARTLQSGRDPGRTQVLGNIPCLASCTDGCTVHGTSARRSWITMAGLGDITGQGTAANWVLGCTREMMGNKA